MGYQSSEAHEYIVWDINPEPWRVPGVPRYGKAVKNGKLVAYQQALKDELPDQNPTAHIHEGLLYVDFFFWRSTAANQPADATNLQKATEDALQGVLYVNDKSNRYVSSMVCEQSPTTQPVILVRIREFDPELVVPVLPERRTVGRWEDDSWTPPDEELF